MYSEKAQIDKFFILIHGAVVLATFSPRIIFSLVLLYILVVLLLFFPGVLLFFPVLYGVLVLLMALLL